MDVSIFLAQAIGIYFIVMGLALFRHRTLHAAVESFSQSAGLKFFAGVLVLVVGILLVLVHNIWDGSTWQVVITVIAWLTFLKALLYLLVPKKVYIVLVRYLNKRQVFVVGGAVVLIIGLWLASIGFNF